jgi:hypothetical protein
VYVPPVMSPMQASSELVGGAFFDQFPGVLQAPPRLLVKLSVHDCVAPAPPLNATASAPAPASPRAAVTAMRPYRPIVVPNLPLLKSPSGTIAANR